MSRVAGRDNTQNQNLLGENSRQSGITGMDPSSRASNNSENVAGDKNYLGLNWKFFSEYMVAGMLNTVTMGDYYFVLWISLTLLRNQENVDKAISDAQSSALSSYIVVFEICFLTCLLGVSETLGIFGSQAVGGAQTLLQRKNKREHQKKKIEEQERNGNKVPEEQDEAERYINQKVDGYTYQDIQFFEARPYQLMFQGKIVATLVLLVGTPIFLNLTPLLIGLSGGSQAEGKDSNLKLLIYLLTPATFIEIYADQQKHFMFCFHRYKWIGVFSIINVVSNILITWLALKFGGENKTLIVIICLTVFQIFNWISVEVAFNLEFDQDEQKERTRYLTKRICPRTGFIKFGWDFIKNSFTQLYFPIFIQVMFLIVRITCSEIENIAYMSLFKSMRFFFFVGYGFYIYPRGKINYTVGKTLYTKKAEGEIQDDLYNEKRDFVYEQTKADVRVFFYKILKINVVVFAIITLLMIPINYFVVTHSIESYRTSHHYGEQKHPDFSLYLMSSVAAFFYLNIPYVAGCMRSINMKYFLISYNSVVPYFVLPFIFYMKFMNRKITSLKPSKIIMDLISPVSADETGDSDLNLNTIYLYISIELGIRLFVYWGMLRIKNSYDNVHDDMVFAIYSLDYMKRKKLLSEKKKELYADVHEFKYLQEQKEFHLGATPA